MNQNLPFPDDVQLLTLERVGATTFPQDFAEDRNFYIGRITDINFKGDSRMQFTLDGRKTGWVPVYPEELGWLETAQSTPFELAVHYIKIRRVRGAVNNSRQSRLFD